jgi:hypothetical protein
MSWPPPPPPEWTPLAVKQLERLAHRAPGQAVAVFNVVEWLAARSSMPALGRPDPAGRRRRYWPVPPQGIFYAVRGGRLVVLEVRDARRRRVPW